MMLSLGFIVASYILRKRIILFLLCLVMVGSSYITIRESKVNPLESFEGEIIDIRACVESVQDMGRYYRLIVKSKAFNHEGVEYKINEKILINISGKAAFNPQGLAGKDIELRGKVSLPSGQRNPGLFDYRLYLKTRNISNIINASFSHLKILGKGNRLTYYLAKVKNDLSEQLDSKIEVDSKGFLFGMLFGDKTLIDDNLYETFQRNGTSHILAVSGIHVGIVYLYLNKIFNNRKSIICSVLILGLLFIYSALAQFSPSIIRAVTMIGLHILSKHLHLRYDLVSAASFSALLMLIYNPFHLFNIGFQLSYLAVFTLGFLLPLANSKIDKLKDKKKYSIVVRILKLFAPVVVIQIGLAPATAYLFNHFSIAAFFLNIPVIILAGYIIPLGILLIFLSYLGGYLFDFLAFFIELLLQLMINMNALTAEFAFSSIYVTSPSFNILFLYYTILFFISSETFWIFLRKRFYKIIVGLILFFIVIAAFIPLIMNEDHVTADIVFVDVGQGDCMHVRTPSGKNILIDGGGKTDYDVGKNILLPYLLKNKVSKIDLALVTHLHDDHYKGIASLCNLMTVERLGIYEANILKQDDILEETGLNVDNIVYLNKGDKIRIDEDVWIEVLYPPGYCKEEYKDILNEDENEYSLIMKVNFKNISILNTGDLGFEGEDKIVEMYSGHKENVLKADILKVGHHGSRYSTGDRFLDEVSPKLAVIQVGNNNFGHPHSDVIDKLRKRDIMVYRNDLGGAILIQIKDKGIHLKTMLN